MTEEKKKIQINGKIDRQVWRDFFKETRYKEINLWDAISLALKMYTEHLKSLKI